MDLVFVRPSKQQRSIFSCEGYEALTRCGRKLIFLAKTVSNLRIKSGGGSTNKNRRKYTLDQIEVEDFRDSNSDEEKQSHLSELSDPEVSS